MHLRSLSTSGAPRPHRLFEDVFGLKLSPFKANIKAADLLKRFVLAGGFNVVDYQAE